MNGFNVSEAGHVVQVLPPQNISGGVTGTPFSMKNAKHASIIIMIGAIGTNKPTAILLNYCSDAQGTGATAMGFRYYLSKSGGGTIDQQSPVAVATATGILAAALNKINNEYVIIEIDAEELDQYGDASVSSDYPYLELQITDGGNTTYMSAVAILSGQRQAYAGGGPSVTS